MQVIGELFQDYRESAIYSFHRLEFVRGDEKAKEVVNQMQVFLNHNLRRGREWADWEIKHWKQMQDWFEEIDEKMDRS